MARRRRGRGRLSSIDLLPEEAAAVVSWAMEQIRARNLTQDDIRDEFNARLAALGLGPISKSAFNRHALRLATMARRLEETREIAAALTERMEPGKADDLTVMVAEAIKTLVFELMEKAGEGGISTKGAMELARAVQAAASAQKLSTERRREIEKEFAKKAQKAIGAAGRKAGLSAAAIAQIERDVLGIEPAGKAAG